MNKILGDVVMCNNCDVLLGEVYEIPLEMDGDFMYRRFRKQCPCCQKVFEETQVYSLSFWRSEFSCHY